MSRNRKLKGAVGVALAACMTVGTVPMGNLFQYVDQKAGVVTAYAAETQPLATTLNQKEVGAHEGTGAYAYDAAAKKVTVTGSGTKFDKDAGLDDLFYSYYNGKGDLSVSAKMTVTGSTGHAGIIARNTGDEAGSASAALYADGSKNQIRYGYHKESAGGGASKIGAGTETASSTVYVKLEIKGNVASFWISDTPEFPEAATKKQTIEGLDAKTIGFFATGGMTAEFSEVKVASSYVNGDGETVNKLMFDSEVGEVLPSYSTSAAYSGNYDAGNALQTSADGNVLKVQQTRSPAVKGNIRSDTGMDYWVFPATTEDMTLQADFTVTAVDSGTDKQGLAMGQFSMTPGAPVSCDVLHFQKNMVIQHTYTKDGNGGCGDPKASGIALGTTYTMIYEKSGNTALVTVKSASGEVLLDKAVIDLASAGYDEDLQTGKPVQYGFAFSGITVDLSNISLKNAAGQTVYDMNDYYVAVGVAPVIEAPAAAVASDRTSIDLNWKLSTEGSGNVKYSVYVSKDGGAYTKAGDSKVNSFSYTGMNGDGTYTFKVVPYGGETMGAEQVSNTVTYQTPLAAASVQAAATSSQVTVSWTAVNGATSYDVYRKYGSNGTYGVVKNTSELSFVDTNVKKEEPYYYYVIAKNADNTSNPSTTLQVVTTDGHAGAYVYENEATKVTVVSKSNDTVFSDQANLTLKTDEDCTVQVFVNGVLAKTQLAAAGREASIDLALEQGRNDIVLLFTDGQGNTTRKTYNFVSNPVIHAVVDAAYTGTDGDMADGYPTYKTVQAAVDAVPADNAESKVIFIRNGAYEQRIEVKSPYVSLLGEDSNQTHLFYAVCVANGNADSMWNRNAMYVDTTAVGFTAENLTIENTYDYTNGTDQQADALCIAADQTACVNIRLVGFQDTLLTDSRAKDESGNYKVTRQYFEKCYITGNVDFIYGAGTSYFNDCDIVARYTPHKSDGCFTAARTYASTDYGYTFNNCRFLAEDGVVDGAYRMARPWGKDASTTFVNCYLGRAVSTLEDSSNGFYGDMSGNSFRNARFAEFGSYGPGFLVNNVRPYLTSEQAATYQAGVVLGDYDYQSALAALYKAEPVIDDPIVDPTPEDNNGGEDTKKEDPTTPVTADFARTGFFAGLLAASGALGLLAARKKKEEETTEEQ